MGKRQSDDSRDSSQAELKAGGYCPSSPHATTKTNKNKWTKRRQQSCWAAHWLLFPAVLCEPRAPEHEYLLLFFFLFFLKRHLGS